MRLGVVTLATNQAPYLQEAAGSVLGQLQADEPYVLVDSGSVDGTAAACQSIAADPRVTVLSEPDDGPADGLNKALRLIDCDVLYYLNGDDRLLPGTFAYVRTNFSGQGVFYGDAHLIDDRGERTGVLRSSRRFTARGYALGSCVVAQQATFIEAQLLRRVDFNVKNWTCWDGELLYDLARTACRFQRVRRVLGEFRIHGSSISGQGPNSRYTADKLRIFEKHFEEGRGPALKLEALVRRAVRL